MPKYSKCECELRNWKKRFFKIRGGRDKVAAVNQLVALAAEMRGFWPDSRLHRRDWPADLETVKALALPEDAQAPDIKLMHQNIEKIPVPFSSPPKVSEEDPAVIGDVIPMETDIVPAPANTVPVGPVTFGGVVEGRSPIGCTPPAPLLKENEIEVEVYALCPNPRLLSGKTPDGKIVSVWKGPRNWRLPQRIVCRRDPNQQILTPI